jgi:hypothetical protein
LFHRSAAPATPLIGFAVTVRDLVQWIGDALGEAFADAGDGSLRDEGGQVAQAT